ncbi:MAG: hypothetical protein L3J08_07695 [Flavobacteriaceae bacterium]|nr:hypothetical protein [Flavobacteriaceae bacterium]
MQALKREVYIPENHKLLIDIPKDIPTGNSEMFIIINPIIQMPEQGKHNISNELDDLILGIHATLKFDIQGKSYKELLLGALTEKLS